jgi:hypothetical protein
MLRESHLHAARSIDAAVDAELLGALGLGFLAGFERERTRDLTLTSQHPR